MEDFAEDPGEFFYEEYPFNPTSAAESAAPLQIAVQFIPRDLNDGIIH